MGICIHLIYTQVNIGMYTFNVMYYNDKNRKNEQ